MIPIFKKEITDIIKEKTFISTVLLQIFLVAFYSFAILGILVILHPGTEEMIEINLIYENDYPHDLAKHLEESNFRIINAKAFDKEKIQEDLSERTTLIYKNEDEYEYIRLFIDEGSFASTFIISEAKKALETYEEKKRDERIDLEHIPISETFKDLNLDRITIRRLVFEFTYLLMIPILFFLPIYLSGTILIDILTEELKRKTFSLVATAPISKKSMILQKIFASFALSFLQIALWMIILAWRRIQINNPIQLFLVLVSINILFLLIASFISLYLRERVNAQTVFSLIIVAIIVTKGNILNPINMIINLTVKDPSINLVILYLSSITVGIALVNYFINRIIRFSE